MLYCKHPNKLAQLRQNAHLSQKQLAQKLGVSQASINYWENGQRTLLLKQPKKYQIILKCQYLKYLAHTKRKLTSPILLTLLKSLQLHGKLMMIYHPLFLLQKNTLCRNFKVYKTMPPF